MNNCSFAAKSTKGIDSNIVEFICKAHEDQSDERFNELALREFEFLYRASTPYRDSCKRNNFSPGTINRWEEIPAVASFSMHDAGGLSSASGVVELERKRGPVFPDKDTVVLSSTVNNLLAKTFLFPDIERIKMLLAVPVPLMAPGMVMASGLKRLAQRFGTPESRFLISFRGLDLEALAGALRRAEKLREPLALLGATFVIDYFLDACEKEGIRFDLPEGSRIVDSGGYMGRYVKCTKEEYFRKCKRILGVEENHCVNALWICESSTVYFDNVLRNSLSGLVKERCKEMPPWTRVIAVDPRDFKRAPKGKPGLLRLYDLTNRAMAFAVQTDKIGFETEDGFEVAGKWNKSIGTADIDRSPQHPGGGTVTKLMDFFMRRKFSKLGGICSRLK